MRRKKPQRARRTLSEENVKAMEMAPGDEKRLYIQQKAKGPFRQGGLRRRWR